MISHERYGLTPPPLPKPLSAPLNPDISRDHDIAEIKRRIERLEKRNPPMSFWDFLCWMCVLPVVMYVSLCAVDMYRDVSEMRQKIEAMETANETP